MALIAYMEVKGHKQGAIKGDCAQGGDKKDRIVVYGSDHLIEVPRDTHTGLPTGGSIHYKFTVTKHKDQSTPKLFGLCCTGEGCVVVIDYYKIEPDGQESKYFTVKLEGIVSGMREYTPPTFLPENKPYHDMEEVSFSYKHITWSNSAGHIEYSYIVNDPKG
jgi:type VI secretion system effector, Hcp1 family